MVSLVILFFYKEKHICLFIIEIYIYFLFSFINKHTLFMYTSLCFSMEYKNISVFFSYTQ